MTMLQSQPRLLTIEGGEGAGKSTVLSALRDALLADGCEVVCTREPGGTPLAERIRGLLLDTGDEPVHPHTELLLMFAARAQHVQRVVLPALARGAWVLCDRFADSTTAYQGFGRGFSVELMETINRFAIGSAVPDMTILLDVNVSLGMQRCAKRQVGKKVQYDRIESEALEFHEKVRQGYLELARRFPERFRKVDAMRLAEPIAEDVWKLVSDAFLPQG